MTATPHDPQIDAATVADDRTVVAALSARPMKPILDDGGNVTGWRGHAYDRHKRVFYATAAQGEVIAPLMAAGGGQRVVLKYLTSSTLAYLASAEDAGLALLLEPVAHERVLSEAGR
jgi:hypothetical protein